MARSLETFRWRYLRPGEPTIIVGRQALVLDREGFVETKDVSSDTEARMRANGSGFEYVPMNNDALWTGRLGESKQRVDLARLAVLEQERNLMRSNDLLRTCEAQHRDLEAERARYQTAVEGVDEAASASKEEPSLTPPTPLKRKG